MFKVGRQSPGTAELGPTRYRDAAHYGTATVCAGIHPALDDAADCILPDTHVPTYHGHHTSHLLSLFCRSTMLHITIYLLIVLPPTFLAWKMLNACLVYRNEMQCIFQFIFIAQWFIYIYTRWFKYDRDWLCVNKSQFVPVIFEPPCICGKWLHYFEIKHVLCVAPWRWWRTAGTCSSEKCIYSLCSVCENGWFLIIRNTWHYTEWTRANITYPNIWLVRTKSVISLCNIFSTLLHEWPFSSARRTCALISKQQTSFSRWI